MRSILDRANMAPPTLYHYFDSLYHLYDISHERALSRAEAWFGRRLEDLDRFGPLSEGAYASLISEILAQWCNEGRELAFAMYECRLGAMRNGELLDVADGWAQLWLNVWQRVSDLCGYSQFGLATALFAAGQVLPNLIRTSAITDRCALDEVCRGWAAWLEGRLASENIWYQFSIRAANYADAPPVRLEGRASEIANEAAEMLIEQGARKLTYRGLANRLSITAPTIQHYFKTVDDLFRGTFSALYWMGTDSYSGKVLDVRDINLSAVDAHNLIRDGMVLSSERRRKSIIAWIELHLALARTPSLLMLAARFRYRSGHAARRLLDPLLPNGIASDVVDRSILANTSLGVSVTKFLSSEDDRHSYLQAESVLSVISSIGKK